MNKVFFVSPEGRFYWSGRIPNPSEDLHDGPVIDLVRALEMINERISKGEICDYTIKIKGGVYRLPSAIQIGNQESVRITVEPYDGEYVSFNGSKRIKNWEETFVNGKRCLRAYIPEAANNGLSVKNLFINNEPAKKTVYPSDGSKLKIKSLPEGSLEDALGQGNRAFEIDPKDIEFISDIKSCEISVIHYWIDEHLDVADYDSEKHIIYSSKYSRFKLQDDKQNDYALYRIENVFEELKNAGQWYFDKKNCYVYYMPKENENAENILGEIPITDSIININGTAECKSGGITFKNITFECTADSFIPPHTERFGKKVEAGSSPQGAAHLCGAVNIKFADRCVFDGCTFRNLGGYAINIGEGCMYSVVTDCDIYNNAGGGIKINGGDINSPLSHRSGCNLIENNRIHHNSLVYKSAIGILTQHSFSNRITRNSIHDMEYSGISCGWVWGYSESVSKNNIIEYNHIYNLGSGDMSDMGGIYLLGIQPGTVVRGNHIHHIKKANYGGWGIYLDEGSSHIVVEKNIVHHTASSPFNIHYGAENTVRYNIFAFGDMGLIGFVRGEPHLMVTFYKNILVADNNPIIEGEYNFYFTEKLALSDNNFICDISGSPITNMYSQHEGAGDEIQTWEYWKSKGNDVNSYCGELGFSDINTFTLSEDSIVYKMSFPKDVSIHNTPQD